MNEKLAINKLPLPQNYNGYEWNTQFMPTRKSIPNYLHEDLPALKYQLLREQFKQVSKFECPNIDYFKDSFKKGQLKLQTKTSSQDLLKKKLNKQKKAIIQQWQYAILTNDKSSNVLNSLLDQSEEFDKKIDEQRKLTQTKINKEYISSNISDRSTLAKSSQKSVLKPNIRSFKLPDINYRKPQIIPTLSLQSKKSLNHEQSNLSNLQDRLNSSIISNLIPQTIKHRRHSMSNEKSSLVSKLNKFSKKEYTDELKSIKYFHNTVELIFRHQRQKLLKQNNQEDDLIINENDSENLKQYKQKVIKIVDNIKLEQYS